MRLLSVFISTLSGLLLLWFSLLFWFPNWGSSWINASTLAAVLIVLFLWTAANVAAHIFSFQLLSRSRWAIGMLHLSWLLALTALCISHFSFPAIGLLIWKVALLTMPISLVLTWLMPGGRVRYWWQLAVRIPEGKLLKNGLLGVVLIVALTSLLYLQTAAREYLVFLAAFALLLSLLGLLFGFLPKSDRLRTLQSTHLRACLESAQSLGLLWWMGFLIAEHFNEMQRFSIPMVLLSLILVSLLHLRLIDFLKVNPRFFALQTVGHLFILLLLI